MHVKNIYKHWNQRKKTTAVTASTPSTDNERSGEKKNENGKALQRREETRTTQKKTAGQKDIKGFTSNKS